MSFYPMSVTKRQKTIVIKPQGEKGKKVKKDMKERKIYRKRLKEREALYQAERRQLSKVMTYGMPENCSVLLFCMILLNVMLL